MKRTSEEANLVDGNLAKKLATSVTDVVDLSKAVKIHKHSDTANFTNVK